MGPVVWCVLVVGLVTFVGIAVPRVCPGTSPQQKGTMRYCGWLSLVFNLKKRLNQHNDLNYMLLLLAA